MAFLAPWVADLALNYVLCFFCWCLHHLSLVLLLFAIPFVGLDPDKVTLGDGVWKFSAAWFAIPDNGCTVLTTREVRPQALLQEGTLAEDVGLLSWKVPLAHLVILGFHCLVHLTKILGGGLASKVSLSTTKQDLRETQMLFVFKQKNINSMEVLPEAATILFS